MELLLKSIGGINLEHEGMQGNNQNYIINKHHLNINN